MGKCTLCKIRLLEEIKKLQQQIAQYEEFIEALKQDGILTDLNELREGINE